MIFPQVLASKFINVSIDNECMSNQTWFCLPYLPTPVTVTLTLTETETVCTTERSITVPEPETTTYIYTTPIYTPFTTQRSITIPEPITYYTTHCHEDICTTDTITLTST